MARLRRASHVTRRRSVVKSVSWRILASLDTFVIAFLITGRLSWGAFIAGAEVLTKMVLYYVHERAWAHVAWGLRQ
jgi:uncharacterized membrane protein